MKRTLLTSVLLLSFAVPSTGMSADVDASVSSKRGKLLFLQCGACHAVQAGAPQGVGPNLIGIVGRKAGVSAGFTSYSAALRNAGLTWDEATLDRWLENPSALVPGNNMAFAGLPKSTDRQALIAYLQSLSPSLSTTKEPLLYSVRPELAAGLNANAGSSKRPAN